MTAVWAWLALMLTSVMLATVPVLARLAQEEGIPALAVATLRLLTAVTLLTPYVLIRYRDDLRRVTRRDGLLIGFAGLVTALFFVFYFNSVNHTSILIASVLNGTAPLWVALVEVIILHALLRRSVWIGLGLVLAGSILYALPGEGAAIITGDNPLLGGGLALLAAWMNTGYFLVAREVRKRVAVLPFLWLMLVVALIAASIFSLVTGTPLTSFEAKGYLWVLLMAIGPQLIGHASLAFALARIPASSAAITTQLAVIVSALLALIAFQEVPRPLQIAASAFILAGVLLVILQPTPSAQTVPE